MLLHCSHCVKADVFWCEIGIEKESWGWTRLKRSGGSEGGGIFIYCLFVEMQEEWGGGLGDGGGSGGQGEKAGRRHEGIKRLSRDKNGASEGHIST